MKFVSTHRSKIKKRCKDKLMDDDHIPTTLSKLLR